MREHKPAAAVQEYGCRALRKLASQDAAPGAHPHPSATDDALRPLLPLLVASIREHLASSPAVLLQGALAFAQIVSLRPGLRPAAKEVGSENLCTALDRAAAAQEARGDAAMAGKLLDALRRVEACV